MEKHEQKALFGFLGKIVIIVAVGIIVALLLSIPASAQGLCISPDGALSERSDAPVDYAELEADGNCTNGTGNTAWHSMCFTFTPTSANVDLNMGYSTVCNNAWISTLTLYDNTCTSIGTGLSFVGLTPGQQYTWCVLIRATGGPGCNGFDRVCPYWMDSTPLPIKLEKLECNGDILTWITATEVNNDYFSVESSRDTANWVIKTYINGAGTSFIKTYYEYQDVTCKGNTYYRITQTDYDGDLTVLPTVICKCDGLKYDVRILGAYNELGQPINPYGRGFKILRIMEGKRVIYKKIITYD